MKKLIVKDNNGKDYIVNDPDRFRKHLYNFHTYNDNADLSVHEESGHYFTVTNKLLDEVNEFTRRIKKQ